MRTQPQLRLELFVADAALLAERDAKAAVGKLQRGGCSDDPAADDDDIHLLRQLGIAMDGTT